MCRDNEIPLRVVKKMFNFRYFFKQVMAMFGCLRCVSHLLSLLKKMIEGLHEESYFLDVRRIFLARIYWNDHKHCVIPEMRESFTELGNYYRMGAIAKYKSMKNGSMLHNHIIHKKNGQWMVVFSKRSKIDPLRNRVSYSCLESLDLFT